MDIIINGITENAPIASKPLSSQGDYYHNLLVCLGYNPFTPPLADLLRHYHHLEGQWLVATPIHWQATHNDAKLVATGRELGLTEEESRLWFAEVAQFLQADGLTLVYHDEQTWLLKIDHKPKITSQSVNSMLHQSLMPVLDKLDSTFFWQRLITELQMYLSSHPLNAKRDANLPINGLWFWGEGEFVLSENRPIATDDDVILRHAASASNSIKRLTAATVFAKNQVLIIHDPQQITSCHLAEKTQKNSVHWYWNNLAYLSQANRWWSKLLSHHFSDSPKDR
jgi:hypothetical protein